MEQVRPEALDLLDHWVSLDHKVLRDNRDKPDLQEVSAHQEDQVHLDLVDQLDQQDR